MGGIVIVTLEAMVLEGLVRLDALLMRGLGIVRLDLIARLGIVRLVVAIHYPLVITHPYQGSFV